MRWEKIQAGARNSVVQIFNYLIDFDWLQPFDVTPGGIATGSGFFVTETGLILTNAHVVANSASLVIQIPALGKEKLPVKVQGIVPERDVAILELTPESLEKIGNKIGKIKALKLGNSDALKPTAEVITLGYPLSEQILKVSKGVISGITDGYIQIDAAISPGSSGSPSFNDQGEVIGINSAINPNGQNVSLIIPINTVLNLLPPLKTRTLYIIPKLGIELQESSQELIAYVKNPAPGGVYMRKVFPNLLMAKAGVQPGDMLYKINKNVVDRFGEVDVPWSEDHITLSSYFNRVALGKLLQLEIYRKGKRLQLKVPYEQTPRIPISLYFPGFDKIEYEAFGGLILMELRLNHVPIISKKRPLFNRFMKPENQLESKIVVTSVLPGSEAQKSNILAIGDIITSINKRNVSTLPQVRKALCESKEAIPIRTEDKELVIFSFSKIVLMEPELVKRFNYTPSEFLMGCS